MRFESESRKETPVSLLPPGCPALSGPPGTCWTVSSFVSGTPAGGDLVSLHLIFLLNEHK